MIILTIRTDKPEAELGLFDEQTELAYEAWHAHRELSNTLLQKIADLLASRSKVLTDIQGIVCFQGPGSFTGLRIGLTVANTLTYSLGLPIVATMGEDWLQKGIERLHAGEDDRITLPHYGADAHITLPRK
jgi:tRNA threonylcarbamoyladenosine biosynthesis protein TsaB